MEGSSGLNLDTTIIFDSFPATSIAEKLIANVNIMTNEIVQILFKNKNTYKFV